ncbi:MAG: 5'-nucleotidase C-terminal domain-containing protein, partial [Paraclostridium sp.]
DTKELEYELVEVKDLDIEIDEELKNIFEAVESKLQVYLDQEVGEFDKDILVDDIFEARLKGHPFTNFLHQVQLETANADVSVLSVFDSTIGFKKNISIRDVLINYPYPNTLKVLKVKGSALKEAMEKSATYFVKEGNEVVVSEFFLKPKVQHYNYDTFGGLDYEVDLDREFGDRVVSIKKDGKDIDLDGYYSVVMNNYRATNTSIYPSYEGAKVLAEINVDASEVIINYIQKHKKIETIANSNYKFKY